MKFILASFLVLPLAGCITIHESAPERREVRVEREVIIDTASSPATYLRSVRVPVSDVEAGAAFYKNAFGMNEIRRLGAGNSLQIVLNTGDSLEQAESNPHSPLVIVNRPEGLQVGVLAALIMNVPDVDAAIAAVVDAGGTIVRPKMSIANGPTFAFVKDPEGNQLELLLAQ